MEGLCSPGFVIRGTLRWDEREREREREREMFEMFETAAGAFWGTLLLTWKCIRMCYLFEPAVPCLLTQSQLVNTGLSPISEIYLTVSVSRPGSLSRPRPGCRLAGSPGLIAQPPGQGRGRPVTSSWGAFLFVQQRRSTWRNHGDRKPGSGHLTCNRSGLGPHSPTADRQIKRNTRSEISWYPSYLNLVLLVWCHGLGKSCCLQSGLKCWS